MSEVLGTGETVPTTEIERKFLPLQLPPDLNRYPHVKIAQGYLANDSNGAVRVRQKGQNYFITYKGIPGSHAAERIELETELTEEQFNTLWPGTEGRRVEKTRYRIPYDDGRLTIELDVFEGDNEGYAMAEVEFDSTADADAFVVPAWLGTDVTADKRYGNASIAEHGFPTAQ